MRSFFTHIKNILLFPIRLFLRVSWKKKILLIVALIIVIGILSQVFGKGNGEVYKTEMVAYGNVTEVVSETGNIVTNGRTDIYSPTNGVIESVNKQNGDAVVVGDELFTIKSTATEQEKSQAWAQYLAAKNSLDAANATMYSLRSQKDAAWKQFYDISNSSAYEYGDDTPKVSERNSSAEFQGKEADWLAAESNYKNQQAVISQAQAAASSTYLLYQATQNAVVKATADGTVSNVSVTIGSTVKANMASSPQVPLATIATLGTTEILVPLSESDIAKVKMGQDVTIKLSAINNRTYKGIVQRVDTIGTDDQGVIRYNAYIEILNPDENLRPGMNVDVEIVTKELTNVLTVSNSSVKPYQGGRAVRIIGDNGELEYIPVEIGVRGESKTQILDGINEGQLVVTTVSNEKIQRPGLFGN